MICVITKGKKAEPNRKLIWLKQSKILQNTPASNPNQWRLFWVLGFLCKIHSRAKFKRAISRRQTLFVYD